MSRSVLLLSDNPGSDYIGRIRTGVERVCRDAGYSVVSENVFGTGTTTEDVVKASNHAGMVLTPPVSDDRHILSMLEERRIPFVRIAPLLDADRGNCVGMDEFEAASQVVRLMTQRGHRRIAILRGPRSHLVSMRRFHGYADAIGSKGMKVDQSLMEEGDFTRDSGRRLGPALFAARPTAIFACNDEMAAGVIDAARSAGIRIPEDISLVGYDDNAVATTVRPRLTTVRQPLGDMGEAAARLLLESIKLPSRATRRELVPFEIVERESVADVKTEE